MRKASTIYLDPELHKALKMQSAVMECSISDLAEAAIKSFLMDIKHTDKKYHDHDIYEPKNFIDYFNDPSKPHLKKQN